MQQWLATVTGGGGSLATATGDSLLSSSSLISLSDLEGVAELLIKKKIGKRVK